MTNGLHAHIYISHISEIVYVFAMFKIDSVLMSVFAERFVRMSLTYTF